MSKDIQQSLLRSMPKLGQKLPMGIWKYVPVYDDEKEELEKKYGKGVERREIDMDQFHYNSKNDTLVHGFTGKEFCAIILKEYSAWSKDRFIHYGDLRSIIC